MKTLIAMLPAAVFVLALSAATFAVSGGIQVAQAQSQDFSEQQLQAYVMAEREVRDIAGSAREDLANAENQQEAEAVREEANQKMVEAVRQSGLDVEQFNQIARAAQEDQALADKIEKIEKDMNAEQ